MMWAGEFHQLSLFSGCNGILYIYLLVRVCKKISVAHCLLPLFIVVLGVTVSSCPESTTEPDLANIFAYKIGLFKPR